jgi:tape measure domain-containing protein
MANGTTRVINLRLDADQMNAALNKTASNTTKLAKEVTKANTSLGKMQKDFKTTKNQITDFNQSIVLFRRLMTAAFAVRLAEGLISDLQAVDNQLKIATNSAAEYNLMQRELLAVSQETRQSFEGTVKLYARITRANDELGLSSNQIVKVTENINKALAAQGASAQESRSVLLQLSQAFGSGVLAGEEFRAVAEGAPLILKDLAASLNVNVGALKAMAAAGLITADVLATALQEGTNIQKEYAASSITLGQSLQKMGDAFGQFARQVNDSTGGFNALAQGISALADAMSFLGAGMIGLMAIGFTLWVWRLAAALVGGAIPAVSAFASELFIAALGTQSVTGAVWGAVGAFRGLTLAIAATGIGLLFIALGFIGGRFIELADAVGGFSNAFEIGMKFTTAAVIDFFATVLEWIPFGEQMFSGLIAGSRELADSLIADADKIADAVNADRVAALVKANQVGKVKPKSQAETDQERVTKLAETVTKEYLTAAQIYAAAEADIITALFDPQTTLSQSDATQYLADLKASLDPTTEAAAAFEKQVNDMNAAVVAANVGMSEQELAFRILGQEAGKSRAEVDKAWATQVAGQKVLDDSKTAMEEAKKATDDLKESQKSWRDAMQEAITPQQAYWQNLTRLKFLADELNVSMADQAVVFSDLANKYWLTTAAGKAYTKMQADLLSLTDEVNSTFDSATIVAEYDTREALLNQLLNTGKVSAESYNKEIERMDAEKNVRLIAAGTETMQILGQAAEDFTSGFGDAMLDFAQGSEDAFEDFAVSMINNIAKMVIEMLILIPLLEAMNTLIAGMGSGGGATVDVSAGGGGTTGFSSASTSLRTTTAGITSTAGVSASRSVASATSSASNTSAAGVKRGGGNMGGGGDVYVNVNNETPADIDVRQKQTSDGTEIEVMVTSAVRQSFQNGRMDDVMSTTYGIQRRGA